MRLEKVAGFAIAAERGEGEALHLARVHLEEAGGVPDLGAEVAADLELLLAHLGIAVERRDEGDGEAERIGGIKDTSRTLLLYYILLQYTQ